MTTNHFDNIRWKKIFNFFELKRSFVSHSIMQNSNVLHQTVLEIQMV